MKTPIYYPPCWQEEPQYPGVHLHWFDPTQVPPFMQPVSHLALTRFTHAVLNILQPKSNKRGTSQLIFTYVSGNVDRTIRFYIGRNWTHNVLHFDNRSSMLLKGVKSEIQKPNSFVCLFVCLFIDVKKILEIY